MTAAQVSQDRSAQGEETWRLQRHRPALAPVAETLGVFSDSETILSFELPPRVFFSAGVQRRCSSHGPVAMVTEPQLILVNV